MTFDIEPLFARHASAAVERLRYLYPNVSFTLNDAVLFVDGVTGADEEREVRRDWSYQLYREKISEEGMPLRRAMYSALFR